MADLSPDALARLEAKLAAELEMVRKVRALMQEHWPALGASVPPQSTTAAAPAPAAAQPAPGELPVAASSTPSRGTEDWLLDCLAGMSARPFSPGDLGTAMYELAGRSPDGRKVKTFIARMIRQGRVVVHQERKGRPGNLYRATHPQPTPAADQPTAANHQAAPPDSPPAGP